MEPTPTVNDALSSTIVSGGSARGTFTEQFGAWLFRQNVITVLLFAILSVITYGGWWAMNTGVPAHLTSIKEGYKEISAQHAETVRSILSTHEKTVDRITATQDKDRQAILDLVRQSRNAKDQ